MRTLLLLLLIPAMSFARQPHYSDEQMLNNLKWGAAFELGLDFSQESFYGSKREILKTNKVSSLRAYNVSKHGKKKFWYERTYDASGRLVHMKSEDDETDFIFTDSLLTVIRHRIGKNVFDYGITYDERARIVKVVFLKNNKITEETNYVYFDDHRTSLVEKKMFGKKTRTYRLETDYDDLLKSASESRYIVDGELKKRWTYSCDEKGKLEKNKVDEVTQCTYSAANNDGSYIKYVRTVEDGEDYLQESTYSKDSVLIDYKRFLNDSILVSHSTYSREKTVYEGFNKHGKRMHKFIREDDKNGNAVKYINYFSGKEKNPRITSLVYSENNLIREVTYNRGGKVQFDYTYY